MDTTDDAHGPLPYLDIMIKRTSHAETDTSATATWKDTVGYAAAAHVGEPVIDIGMFSTPNAVTNTLVGKVSPLMRFALKRRSRQAAGGLPLTTLWVLTATKLVVFAYRSGSGGAPKPLGQPLRTYQPGQVRIVAGVERPTGFLHHFHPFGEPTINLQTNRSPYSATADFNASFISAVNCC